MEELRIFSMVSAGKHEYPLLDLYTIFIIWYDTSGYEYINKPMCIKNDLHARFFIVFFAWHLSTHGQMISLEIGVKKKFVFLNICEVIIYVGTSVFCKLS